MNWLEKYKLKQQQKYNDLIKKQNNNYQIPSKYLDNPLFAEYNEYIYGKFSNVVGKELEELFDEDSVICIHRTMLDIDDNKNQIDDIFNNGLMNSRGPDYEYTLTSIEYFPLVITQILTASHYRQGTCRGVVIAKIPKKDLGLKEGEPKPIWFKEDEYNYRLLPEYIYGYISSVGDRVETIYRNKNYREFHDYENAGLYYDVEANVEKNKSI